MLHPISGGQGPLPAAISESPRVPPVQEEEPKQESRPPMQDRYIPEEPHVPTGLYWMGKDDGGQPAIFFDDPAAPSGEEPQEEEPAPAGHRPANPDKKSDSVTGSTDQVDREIRQLKAEKAKLQQQLASETDERKTKALEKKLAGIEAELRQKDTDAYRRQHTVFTPS